MKKRKKTQKVRFHKGDRKPAKTMRKQLSYKTEMEKQGKKIVWNVVEEPTGNIVGKYFFEEDAQQLVDFQNKHRVWQVNGGIPKMLWNY